MKKVFMGMIMLICLLWLLESNCFAQGLVKISDDRDKVICVVFDNSSSMFKDDNGERDYTDRWVQADYAVRTLALMMNEGDILRPYIMGDYKNGSGSSHSNVVRISSDKTATLEALESVMGRMEFTQWTYFQGVESAAEGLNSPENKGKDCWIIILTDGEFNQPEKIDSGEKLKDKLEEITVQNPEISIAYVPIGNCQIHIEEERDHRLYTAAGNNILEQVTQVVNLIYARVQLDEGTKQRYIQQSDADGKLYVNMDIPIERMMVLLQDSEPSTEYVKIENLEEALQQKIVKESPSVTDAFLLTGENTISGRKNIPGKEGDVKVYDPDQIKYSILRGMLYDFKGNGDFRVNMQNEYVSIDVTRDAYETVDVYYQPAIFVQANYYQDGKLIEHGDDCLAISDNSASERCIRAGELIVELYMADSQGEPIQNQNSPLLYGDSFEVELQMEGGRTVQGQALDNYRYKFDVEEGQYELKVLTSWNESYMKVLEVQEPVLPLKLELMGEGDIWIDQPTGEGSIFGIRLWEGEEIITPPSAPYADIVCMIQDEDFQLEPLGYQGNGIWEFRITLADYERHQIADSIECQISAVRLYESGTAAATEASVEESYLLDIVSSPFELSAEEEYDDLRYWFKRLFGGEKIPMIYTCGDVELTAKQKAEGLVISDFQIEPSFMQKYFEIDKEGNLHLEDGLYGLFSRNDRPEEINVRMMVAYERYNTQATIIYEHIFTIKYIPVWARILIFTLLGAVVLWFGLCIGMSRTPYAIKRYRAALALPSGSTSSKVILKRKWNILIPFCKTAHLIFVEARGLGTPNLKGFDMVITNNFGGDGWRIVNYGDFSHRDYQIGGNPINKDNRIFSAERPFSVQDKRGRRRVLTMEK